MPTPELENDECDCGSCASIRERHFTSGLVWGVAIVGMFEAIRARHELDDYSRGLKEGYDSGHTAASWGG